MGGIHTFPPLRKRQILLHPSCERPNDGPDVGNYRHKFLTRVLSPFEKNLEESKKAKNLVFELALKYPKMSISNSFDLFFVR